MPPPKGRGKAFKGGSLKTHILTFARKKGTMIVLEHAEIARVANINSCFEYIENTKELILVPERLEKEEPGFLAELIKGVFQNGGVLLRQDTDATLTDYSDYAKQNPDNKILVFFKGIISDADYEALKASLFLRSEQNKNRPVHGYKTDIRERFGERGANIANLCSARYFEEEFQPLFNNLPREEWNELYENAVQRKARALFVHRFMTPDQIQDGFNELLRKAIKYHLKDFRIHAIGDSNVQVTKEFVKKLEDENDNRFIIIKVEEVPRRNLDYIVRILKSP